MDMKQKGLVLRGMLLTGMLAGVLPRLMPMMQAVQIGTAHETTAEAPAEEEPLPQYTEEVIVTAPTAAMPELPAVYEPPADSGAIAWESERSRAMHFSRPYQNTGSGGGSSTATAKVPESVEKGAEFKVTVPAGKTEEISITVNGANSGTVLYAVAADGTKTLIKDTALRDGKLVAKVSGTTTLVAEDNAKSFDDVHPLRWSKKAVDFVSARELFNGTGDKTFGPDETMTRGMLMTVLARLDGADAVGTDWLKKGMDWSVAKGISDGSDPNRPITREEIVTMLWRYAGSPVAGAQAAESLAGRPDGAKVNDWAQAAMAWALDNGVLNGDENGYLNPAAPATREEVAQFIMNYVCR